MLSDGDYYLHLKKLRVKDYEDRYEDITTKINKVVIYIYILLILISLFNINSNVSEVKFLFAINTLK